MRAKVSRSLAMVILGEKSEAPDLPSRRELGVDEWGDGFSPRDLEKMFAAKLHI